MSEQFLSRFFQLELPTPGRQYFGGADAKSDLKLILEIATNSRLKQGQDKKNERKQIFYCRSLGKSCFKIEVEFSQYGSYRLNDDYSASKHKEGCQRHGENPNVIKIYNLMMLKRQLILEFMAQNSLLDASPEIILQKISGEIGEYFYCEAVTDLESRRKLKKRFDNIINITIKKKKNMIADIEQSIADIQVKQNEIQRRNNEKNYRHGQKKQGKKRPTKIKRQVSIKNLSLPYLQPRRQAKIQSNSSILCLKNLQNHQQDNKIKNSSQNFVTIKSDSLFQQEQDDYFKKNSNINIVLNKLNEAGSQNFWPESDNQIGQGTGDRLRVDDLFASLRNSLMKSLQKKSLAEIEHNCENVNNTGNQQT